MNEKNIEQTLGCTEVRARDGKADGGKPRYVKVNVGKLRDEAVGLGHRGLNGMIAAGTLENKGTVLEEYDIYHVRNILLDVGYIAGAALTGRGASSEGIETAALVLNVINGRGETAAHGIIRHLRNVAELSNEYGGAEWSRALVEKASHVIGRMSDTDALISARLVAETASYSKGDGTTLGVIRLIEEKGPKEAMNVSMSLDRLDTLSNHDSSTVKDAINVILCDGSRNSIEKLNSLMRRSSVVNDAPAWINRRVSDMAAEALTG